MNPEHWFSTAWGFQCEFFILGDPRIQNAAYVFVRDTRSGKVYHNKMVGVFDEYTRVRTIPKWVREPLIEVLLQIP